MSVNEIATNTYSDKLPVATERSDKSGANLDPYRLGAATLDVRNLATGQTAEMERQNLLPSIDLVSGDSQKLSGKTSVEASAEGAHSPWKSADFCSQRLNDLQKAGDLDPLLRIPAGQYVAGLINGNISPEASTRLRGILIQNGADMTKIDAIIAEGNDLKAHGKLEVLPGYRK